MWYPISKVEVRFLKKLNIECSLRSQTWREIVIERMFPQIITLCNELLHFLVMFRAHGDFASFPINIQLQAQFNASCRRMVESYGVF